jgi:hypothetical protein
MNGALAGALMGKSIVASFASLPREEEIRRRMPNAYNRNGMSNIGSLSMPTILIACQPWLA